jgi:hypothetical protein
MQEKRHEALCWQSETVDLGLLVHGIYRVQAIIEFNLEGTVVTANHTLLGCLGNSL